MTTSPGAASAGQDSALVEEPGAEPEVRASAPPTWFYDFYRAHYRDLVRTAAYALFMCGLSGDDAEDVVTEVLLRQIKSGSWTHIDNPLSYFRRAVVNQAKSESRRCQRRAWPTEDPPDESDGAALSDFDVWADAQWVKALFDALPPEQRDVMYLVYTGLGTREIAARLGKTEATVRSTLRHARHTLRTQVPPHTHTNMTNRSDNTSRQERL